MNKVSMPVPSVKVQAAAQVDRAKFQREYFRIWQNYLLLAAQPDQAQFDRLVEPLLQIALGVRHPIPPELLELWLSS